MTVVGSIGEGADAIYSCGIETVMPLVNGPMPLEDSIANAEVLCADAGMRLFRAIRAGMSIHSSAQSD